MSSYYDNPFIGGISIADASNNNVMWEPETRTYDIYVNHGNPTGSTIEKHTKESLDEEWIDSLPRDPSGEVIWEMVPLDYHYLKEKEKEKEANEVADGLTNAFLNHFIEGSEVAGGKSVFSTPRFDNQKKIYEWLKNADNVLRPQKKA